MAPVSVWRALVAWFERVFGRGRSLDAGLDAAPGTREYLRHPKDDAVSDPRADSWIANLRAELCPGVPAGRLIAVGNVMVVGFVLIGSTLCGMVIDATGSYPAVFTANLVLALVAAGGYLFVVREPRATPGGATTDPASRA
jgi:hypothetical protein